MNKLLNKWIFAIMPMVCMMAITGCDDDEETAGEYGKPDITAVSPQQALAGSEVTITGTNLKNVVKVKFGSREASAFSVSENTITATVPEGLSAGAVDLAVFFAGASEKNLGPSDRFTFVVLYPPTLEAADPVEGKPGTEITLSGMYLEDATMLTFGETEAEFTATATGITTKVPADAAPGESMITVTTPGGTANIPFKVIEQLTEIHGIDPAEGEPGDEVTLTGLKFVNVQSVRIGNTEADFTVVNETTLTFIVPDGAGSGKVTVTTDRGSFESAAAFTVKGGDVKVAVYDEGLHADWEKWGGWGTSAQEMDNSEHTLTGTNAIKITYSDGYGGFQLHPKSPSPYTVSEYTTVRLSVYGGTGSDGKQVVLYIKSAAGGDPTDSQKKRLDLVEGQYVTFDIPLSDLGSPADINELVIQNWGTADLTIYIDAMGLL